MIVLALAMICWRVFLSAILYQAVTLALQGALQGIVAGTLYYGVCVSVVSLEVVTNNNCSEGLAVRVARAELIPADLGITSLVVSPVRIAADASVSLTGSIQNHGRNVAQSARLRFYRSTDREISNSDSLLANISLADLAVGSTLNFAREVSGHSAGRYYYGVCVSDVSGETETNNNCAEGVAVEVVAPDLALTSFTATPIRIVSGDSITTTGTVQNNASILTAVTLNIYRSSDNTISIADTLLASIPLGSVSGDAIFDFAREITGHGGGRLYYGACLAVVSGETETDNNCSRGVEISAFPLVNVHNIRDNATLQLSGSAGTTTIQIGSATYLFVTGSFDNGVSVFEISDDGGLTNVDNTTDNTGGLQLNGANFVTTSQIGSNTYLFVSGNHNDEGISVFQVANNGSLTNVYNIKDSTDLLLNGAISLTTAQIGSNTYLFATSYREDSVSVFQVANNGSLTNVYNIKDSTDLLLDGAISLTTAQIGSNTYLFVSGNNDSGVSVFEVSSDGSLVNIYNVEDNAELELAGADFLTTAQIGSATYLFVAGNVDDGVSVFEVANDGMLTNVYNITDGGDLNLFRIRFVYTSQIGSNTYLFAVGGSDNGVSIFQVANNGALTNVANIADNADILLNGAFSVTTAQIGSATYLFVVGNRDSGVSVFRIDNNALTNNSSAISHALNIRRGRSYAGNIAAGTSAGTSSGTAFENSENHYRLYLPAGFFTFATKGNLDTFCTLYGTESTLSNAENFRLAFDNDTGAGENCAITYNIRDAGYYLIKVSGHSAADIGNYTLTFP